MLILLSLTHSIPKLHVLQKFGLEGFSLSRLFALLFNKQRVKKKYQLLQENLLQCNNRIY